MHLANWEDGLSDENDSKLPMTPRNPLQSFAVDHDENVVREPISRPLSQRRGTSHALNTPYSQLPAPQSPRRGTNENVLAEPNIPKLSFPRRFRAATDSELVTLLTTPRRAAPSSNDEAGELLVIPPIPIAASRRSPTLKDINATENDLKILQSPKRAGTIDNTALGTGPSTEIATEDRASELVIIEDESSESLSESVSEEDVADDLQEAEIAEPEMKKAPYFTPFFGIAFDLVRKFGKFTPDDFWIMEKDCQAQNVYAEFLVYWRRELENEKPNFYFALFATLWKDLFLAVFFQFIYALFTLFSPILVNLEMGFIFDQTKPYYYGYIYAGALAVVCCFSCYFVLSYYYSYLSLRFSQLGCVYIHFLLLSCSLENISRGNQNAWHSGARNLRQSSDEA
jgi:hypothetical protein